MSEPIGGAAASVLRFVECINEADIEGISDLLTEDHVFVDASGEEHRGKASLTAGWGEYLSNWPGYRIHVYQVLVGGSAVAVLGTTTGSHLGEDVEDPEDAVVWTADVRHGQLADWRIYTRTGDSDTALVEFRNRESGSL